MGVYQTKKFLHSEGNYGQKETCTYQMREEFANNVSNKGLMFKIYKEFT